MKKLAIIGLPNTGKSQVFSNLTREYTLVANFPFTTVEQKKAKCKIRGEEYEVIDTPGLHCLYIHSEEELMVRNMLLSENPDVIVQCIDANRLKQSLALTTDLLELGIPMVISLNAIDETIRKGIWIDTDELSRILGVQVVESVAVSDIGTHDLKDAIGKARIGKWGVRYGEIVEEGIALIESELPQDAPYKRKLSILLLLEDPFLPAYLKNRYGEGLALRIKRASDITKQKFRGNLHLAIGNKKNQWIDSLIEKVIKKHKISIGRFAHTVAQLSRHPVFGIPILIGVLFSIFFAVVNVANVASGWMHNTFWTPIEHQVNNLVPQQFWNDFLIGDYGVLTMGISNAILTVLPILSVFFILFNMLEDLGYIPNLCVLSRRLSEKVGLSGNAILPITLGFGCKTMATLTTKSLRSRKERYIAIYLIAFALPCAAQMALNMSILGRLGVRAFVIAFSVLLFVELLAGIILNKLLKEEKKDDFIQELPDIRLPNPKSILIKTYYKLHSFLKEAFPIFIFAAIALFIADKTGTLQALKNLLRPVIVGFLGFPLQMVDVLILCMAKHEAAAGMIIKLIERGELNYVQCIVAVTLTTMFVPCLANVVAMIKELGSRAAVPMIFIINSTAIIIAGILNWVLAVLFKL